LLGRDQGVIDPLGCRGDIDFLMNCHVILLCYLNMKPFGFILRIIVET
jgi:hypothetical protein